MRKLSLVKAIAPATVANVSCGFDTFGFAIDEPGDEVTIRRAQRGSGVRITKITGDEGKLPYESNKNTAGIAVLLFLKRNNLNLDVAIEIKKKIPFASGMGGSAASAAAAVVAINAFTGRNLPKKELLQYALAAEEAISGAGHADNIAPSLLGGFCTIRSLEPLDIIRLPIPMSLFSSLVHPHIEIETKRARKILPKEITLSLARKQWGNIASFTVGLLKHDYTLLKRSMEDFIAEPVRAPLIPHYFEVKEAALACGAIGANISGSGPSLFALSASKHSAEKVARSMQAVFSRYQIRSDRYVSQINNRGARIVLQK